MKTQLSGLGASTGSEDELRVKRNSLSVGFRSYMSVCRWRVVDNSLLTHDQSEAAEKEEEPVLYSTSRLQFHSEWVRASKRFQQRPMVAGGGRERWGLRQETLGVGAERENAPDVLGEEAVLQTPQKVCLKKNKNKKKKLNKPLESN